MKISPIMLHSINTPSKICLFIVYTFSVVGVVFPFTASNAHENTCVWIMDMYDDHIIMINFMHDISHTFFMRSSLHTLALSLRSFAFSILIPPFDSILDIHVQIEISSKVKMKLKISIFAVGQHRSFVTRIQSVSHG